MAFPYLEAVVGFMISGYIFETHLNLRQHAVLKMPTPPKPLVNSVQCSPDLKTRLVDLPFSLYSTFVIKARHGFNKKTIWLFFGDIFKAIFLYIIIGPSIVAAIIVIVQKGGPYLAIYLWGFMFAVSIMMMTLYPIAIAPLFNKFTPLTNGQLKRNIENLASSLKFPLKKLFVLHVSTGSSHSNQRTQPYPNLMGWLHGSVQKQNRRDESKRKEAQHQQVRKISAKWDRLHGYLPSNRLYLRSYLGQDLGFA